MAHERKRHIDEIFKKLLTFSPILGIFGHRQVGKSTFIASSVSEYRTLDDVEQLEAANADPKHYIQSEHQIPCAIDECQLEPKLFPTLKEWVRIHKKPGQFVLSGSVRFTSRKLIRESLAGRMLVLEMFPFSVTEIAREPLSDVMPQLLQHKVFSPESLRCLNPTKKNGRLKKNFDLYLEHGGLPGLCFIRSPKLQRNALNELHDLILARDLRLVSDIKTPPNTIKKLMSYIAKQTFEPYNASEVRRTLGLAPQTQKNLLYAMESIFLIRRIPIPLRKKEVILLEDQLEELVYSGGTLERARRLESAVYRNIRTQFGYRLDKNTQFESYLTRDYARVPIVIKSDAQMLGVIITLSGERPSLSETRSATSFLRNHASAKILYLSVENVPARILDERSMICSIYSVL